MLKSSFYCTFYLLKFVQRRMRRSVYLVTTRLMMLMFDVVTSYCDLDTFDLWLTYIYFIFYIVEIVLLMLWLIDVRLAR